MRKSMSPLLAGFCLLLLVPFVYAFDYQPGPSPTIGAIQTETVEVDPSPRSRTTIGGGEQVTCSIDTGTWSDTDYVYVESGWENISDSIGIISWSASGAGSVYPTTGSTTTLTADIVGSDDSVTVTATIPDSGKLGLDNPLEKLVALQVKAPTGANPSYDKDVALGTPGPPNKQIGANTLFN